MVSDALATSFLLIGLIDQAFKVHDMSTYRIPLVAALVLFPLLELMLTLPWLAHPFTSIKACKLSQQREIESNVLNKGTP